MNIYLGFSVVFFMLFTPSLSISSIQMRPVLATVSTAAMLKRNYFAMLTVILAIKCENICLKSRLNVYSEFPLGYF